MIDKMRKMNLRVSEVLEVVVSFIIIASIIIEGIHLVFQIIEMPSANDVNAYFSDFLGDALTLVIGLEFIKMLNRHSPDLVIEVLIYAIARYLVVYHPDSIGMLFGILSIAILFAIRKHLLIQEDELSPENASLKYLRAIKEKFERENAIGRDTVKDRGEDN